MKVPIQRYWSSNNGVGDGSALSYIPEEVWNESGTNGGSGLWASGGGASLHFSQPAWQKGLSGIGAANGMRAVPDVAMSASATTATLLSRTAPLCDLRYFGGFALLCGCDGFGGPGQGRSGTRQRQSFAVCVAECEQDPFHATPSGNNSVPGVTGFTASGAPYNLATGLGSVDGIAAGGRMGQWVEHDQSEIDFVLTPSASQGTLLAGKTTSFTLSVTESGAAKNKVSLSATAASRRDGQHQSGIYPAGYNRYRDGDSSFDHRSGSKKHCHHRYGQHGNADGDLHAHGDAIAYSALNAASTSMAVVQGASATVRP